MKFVSFDQAACDLGLSRKELAERVLRKQLPPPLRMIGFSETAVAAMKKKVEGRK